MKKKLDEVNDLFGIKKIAKLTTKETDLLDSFNSCQSACEKIIKKIIREHELSEIQMRAFWGGVKQKYKLDPNKDYEISDGILYEKEKFSEEIKNIQKRMAFEPTIREKVFKAFGIKEEKYKPV